MFGNVDSNKFVDLIKLAKEQCGIDFVLEEKQLKCMEMVVKDRTVLEFFLQDMESIYFTSRTVGPLPMSINAVLDLRTPVLLCL